MVIAGNAAKAQVKIGYINMNQLIDEMPETKTIRTQIDAYQKQFIDELTSMNTEYQAKLKDYQTQRPTMTDAVRTAKEAELTDFQKRMNDYQNNAQQQVNNRTNELSKPLFDKAKAAITQVATERGYGYVINSAQTDLIVSPPENDMMAAVKAKLGIK